MSCAQFAGAVFGKIELVGPTGDQDQNSSELDDWAGLSRRAGRRAVQKHIDDRRQHYDIDDYALQVHKQSTVACHFTATF